MEQIHKLLQVCKIMRHEKVYDPGMLLKAGAPIRGFKFAKIVRGGPITCVIQLEIPRGALIVATSYGDKLRADRAKVVKMTHIWKGKNGVMYHARHESGLAYSSWDSWYEYRVGRIARPQQAFSTKMSKCCESGIHFYLTFNRANPCR
jgi:hypothetical protein